MRRLVVFLATLVALAGWSISYVSQSDWAGGLNGLHGWQQWVWPACSEGMALVVMSLLELRQVRRGFMTVVAWLMFIGANAVMVIANIQSAHGDLWSAAAHSAPAIGSMGLWFVLVHGRPTDQSERSVRQRRSIGAWLRSVLRSIVRSLLSIIGKGSSDRADEELRDDAPPSLPPSSDQRVTLSAVMEAIDREELRSVDVTTEWIQARWPHLAEVTARTKARQARDRMNSRRAPARRSA